MKVRTSFALWRQSLHGLDSEIGSSQEAEAGPDKYVHSTNGRVRVAYSLANSVS